MQDIRSCSASDVVFRVDGVTISSWARLPAPNFLWDYDLTEEDVQTLLRSGDETTLSWLASRILESADFADVWRYLSRAEVRALFLHLKLKPVVREAWTYALQVWETAAVDGR